MILSVGHGVRAEKDIAGIPEYQWKGHDKPEEGQVSRGMYPVLSLSLRSFLLRTGVLRARSHHDTIDIIQHDCSAA